MSDQHLFKVSASWSEAAKEGQLRAETGSLDVPHTGAPALGGKGGSVNPEELVLAAVSACFSQTWGLFLAKLKVPLESAAVDGSCTVEKDPAGGFRISRFTLRPRVPSALWEERRADVEKTLSLAEKYCIVSKAVRVPGVVVEVSVEVF